MIQTTVLLKWLLTTSAQEAAKPVLSNNFAMVKAAVLKAYKLIFPSFSQIL